MRVLEITSLPLAPRQLRIHACMRILRVLSCKVRFGKNSRIHDRVSIERLGTWHRQLRYCLSVMAEFLMGLSGRQ